MKNKYGFVLSCLVALLLCTTTGCQLALADKGAKAGEDRLMGVLVTKEGLDLFSMEGYLKDKTGSISDGNIIIDGNAGDYQERLYATQTKKTLTNEDTGETTETDEYIFEGVKGISYFSVRVPATAMHEVYYTTMRDDAITDGHTGYGTVMVGDMITNGNARSNMSSISLDGTIYVSPGGDLCVYYLNPVYQSADGRVYVTSGSGISIGAYDETTQSRYVSEGENTTQTLSSNYTTTENGKATSYSTSIKLVMKVMNRPTGITVLQLDRNSAVLSRMQYTPGKLPKAITPAPGTEYIVVETAKDSGGDGRQVTRMLYGKDAKSLDTFYYREDGVCVQQWTQVDWAK